MERPIAAEVNVLPKRIVDCWVDRASEGALSQLFEQRSHAGGSTGRLLGGGLRNTVVTEDGGRSEPTFIHGRTAREAEVFLAGEWEVPVSVGMSTLPLHLVAGVE